MMSKVTLPSNLWSIMHLYEIRSLKVGVAATLRECIVHCAWIYLTDNKAELVTLHIGGDAKKLTLYIGGDAVNIMRIYCVGLTAKEADFINYHLRKKLFH